MTTPVSNRSDPRTGRARSLRRKATPAERMVWNKLKLLDIAGHFRRQVPVGPYFADFAHHALRIIVELDGEQHGHEQKLTYDAKRTAYLEAQGYRVIRFWNHEVRESLDGVVETILDAVNTAQRIPATFPPHITAAELDRSNTGQIPC
jgi:very-short-patch-repair endonuclease